MTDLKQFQPAPAAAEGSAGLSELERVELDLLVQGLYRVHRVDLRSYAPASLQRRLRRWLVLQGLPSFSAALHPLLRDAALVQTLLQQVTVGVTEMFRDPEVFGRLRSEVLPHLATSLAIKVWHAGCASGEEAFSMAILLREAGLEARSRIYGTDINEAALERARQGAYALESLRLATRNYQASGGQASFGDYYRVDQGLALMDPSLKHAMVFANHNAVGDADFGEMDLILCRNLLIYYDREAKAHCFTLLDRSLRVGGFLVLGAQETLELQSIAGRYQELAPGSRIYRKITATPAR